MIAKNIYGIIAKLIGYTCIVAPALSILDQFDCTMSSLFDPYINYTKMQQITCLTEELQLFN